MRSKLVLAWSIGCALVGGCRFDRTPLSSGVSADRTETDAAEVDAASSEAASGDGGEAGMTSSMTDASDVDAAVSDAEVETDAGGATVPPSTVGPQPQALQCGGTFCAAGLDPEKACCTTAADVTAHAARAADRCGLDLAAVPDSSFGKHCWQRDQLGIVDDRCPGLSAGGQASEPGCCGDDGTCGTLNADHKLGCRHEAGAAPRACAMEPTGATCDGAGQFALRMSVDAAWGGRSGGLWELTDDGRGKIDVYLLAKIVGVDAQTHAIEASGRVCGVRLPAFFSSTLCEAYQPNFPVEIWESKALPGLTLSGRFDCAANGCNLSIDPQTYLLGFSLNNPEAPWPAAGKIDQLRCPAGRGMLCFPDHDDDKAPGVRVELTTSGMVMNMAMLGPAMVGWMGTGSWMGGTAGNAATCRNQYSYRGAPLSASPTAIFNGVRRADRLQLGVRTRLGGSMRWSKDCGHAEGSALAEYVNSRAAGCLVQRGTYNLGEQRVAGANDACASNEAQFVDENLPEYILLAAGQTPDGSLDLADRMPSRGPEVRAVRVGDVDAAVSCADVRDAKY